MPETGKKAELKIFLMEEKYLSSWVMIKHNLYANFMKCKKRAPCRCSFA
jgi:hypothetical protein